MTNRIRFGAEYHPEQRPEEDWREDVESMRRAGVDTVTVGRFAWARIEPRPSERDLGWLDRALDLLHGAGMEVVVAAPTASPPPWLGGSRAPGPPPPSHRARALALLEDLAVRYSAHPAVRAWQVEPEQSDLLGDRFDAEVAVLRRCDPARPVLTTLSRDLGVVDRWRLRGRCDIALVDADPDPDPDSDLAPVVGASRAYAADLARALAGDRRWHLVDQVRDRLPARRRLLADQADARGADVAGGPPARRAAILLDWPSGSGRFDYRQIIEGWHAALWRANITVDFASVADDLVGYDVVFAPALRRLAVEDAERLAKYVAEGGHLVLGHGTATLDDTLGVRVGEPLAPAEGEAVLCHSAEFGAFGVLDWTELVQPAGAEVVARLEDGRAAVTRHRSGGGTAWYLAVRPQPAALTAILTVAARRAGVEPVVPDLPPGVEAVRRGGVVRLLNHTDSAVAVQVGGRVTVLDGYGVATV